MRTIPSPRAVVVFVFLCLSIAFAAGLGEAKEPVTITWLSWFGGVDLENAKDAIRRFEAEHPNIKVELEAVTFSQYWEQITVRAAGGVLPDVVMTIASRAGAWIIPGIILADLSPYIERTPGFDYEDFHAAHMKAYEDGKGGVYALPYDMSLWVIFYNADLLRQAGLVAPGSEWTWDDWLTMAKRSAKDSDGDGEYEILGLSNLPRSWGLHALLGQNYARMFSADKRRATINSPEAREVYQWWVDTQEAPGIYKTPSGHFHQGTATFALEGPWYIPTVRKSGGFRFDVAPLPSRKVRFNVLDGGAFGISQQSRHPDAAWEFVKFYTSTENLEIVMGQAGRGIPGRRSAFASFVTDQDPNEWVFLEEAAVCEPVGALVPPNWYELEKLVNPATNRILTGQEPVSQGLENLEKQMNALIAKFWASLEK